MVNTCQGPDTAAPRPPSAQSSQQAQALKLDLYLRGVTPSTLRLSQIRILGAGRPHVRGTLDLRTYKQQRRDYYGAHTDNMQTEWAKDQNQDVASVPQL